MALRYSLSISSRSVPARSPSRLGRIHSVTCRRRSRRTPPPGSRSRPPSRSSTACATPSSRPAPRASSGASAPSPGFTRSTRRGCSPRPRTRVGSKLVLGRRGRPARAGAAWTSRRTASTTCSRPGPSRSSSSTTSPRARSTRGQVAELVEGAAEVCRAAGLRDPRRRDGGAAGHLPRRGDRLLRHGASGSSTATALIDGSRVEPGDVVVGLAVRRDPRQRLLARPQDRRRRAVRRRPPAAADGLLPRRRPGPASPRRRPRARARDRRRDRRQPRARAARRARRGRRPGWLGAARRLRAGSPSTASPRTSCAACSTSASATARSSRQADAPGHDLVIGRVAAGVDGVVWGDA